MIKKKECWVTEGRHFDTKNEALQYKLSCWFDREIEKLGMDSYTAYRIREKREDILEILNKYYEKGGK